ncbi:MAG: aminotransferase class V-fold PLP-dependent enzyme [Acidobacteria bacterium]|nr:aminotransferase class V-fold PLP-dependent enzyme [Acidobacteriota bacterium]
MPTFGRSILEHWLLDPEYTYLNHGTVGAAPRRVLARQQALREEMERQPSRFLLRELDGHMPAPWRRTSRLREAMAPVAAFLGSRPDDIVFVPNVTTGLNAVVQSLPLGPGDEVVVTSLSYGAIAIAAAAITRDRGASLRTNEIPYPVRQPGAIVDAVISALTSSTKLLVIDHITAQTALVLPVAQVADACHLRGVPVLVDGAHAPGAIAVDIPALGVDWYAANLHKWAHAPRPCGILWAAPRHQTTLHAPVVSWGRDGGFLAEFERVATSDPTAYLAAPEGIALLREWDFPAVLSYVHGLAWDAGRLLTECWSTRLETPKDMVAAMVTVPLPDAAGATDADAARLRLALLVEDKIEVQLHAWRGRLWARVSAQVYNDLSDVERLAVAVLRLGSSRRD